MKTKTASPSEMDTAPGHALTIFGRIPLIMAEVEPIAKSRSNEQQRYKFRGIDDVYQALQAIMAKHGVFTVPKVLHERSEERQSKAGSALIYRILTIEYTFYAADGSSFAAVVIGEGQDSGDKASNKAMSVAHKYALLQVFCIPTDEPKDPEHDSHDLAPKPEPTTKPLPRRQPAPADDIPPPSDREITPAVYAASRAQLTHEIKRDQKTSQEPFEIPFGTHGHDEVYTAIDSQKFILEKDAARAGISDVPTLRRLSAAMKEHGVFVSDLPRGIADWIKETGYKVKRTEI